MSLSLYIYIYILIRNGEKGLGGDRTGANGRADSGGSSATKSPQVRSKRALRSTWPPEMARRCTIFGVHQADSPKRVLRFRPVIAEHPILCEDIDMGRDAELRRVRWAGSLRPIICKTNSFTKEIREEIRVIQLLYGGADRKSQNRLATFGRVRTNVPRSVAHWV